MADLMANINAKNAKLAQLLTLVFPMILYIA